MKAVFEDHSGVAMLGFKGLLNCILIFQVCTLFLYYFGPIYYTSPPIGLAIFPLVTMYLLMLKAGANLGGRFIFTGKSGPRDPMGFAKLCIITSLVITPITIYLRSGDFSGEIGDVYASSSYQRDKSDPLFEYIRMAFGYVLFGLFPIVLLNFNRLKIQWKLLSIISILLNLSLSLVTGVNKYIFDYVIIFAASKLVGFNYKTNFLRNVFVLFVSMTFFVSISAYFFTQGQLSRPGSSAISGINPRINSFSDYNIENGDFLVFYSAITSYLTQGYRAIELSFDLPYDFTWGVGNSSFLSRQVDRLLGTNFLDYSYPAKIEIYNWDRYNNWSTFYLWWASDLTYAGVLILMFFIGFIYAAIGNTAEKNSDVSSVLIMNYLTICLFYLSANNQIMQSGEMCFGFFALLLPYLYKRKLTAHA